VPSMIAYSESWSPVKFLKTLSNTPFKAHRRKRLKVEFQLPNWSGRSRHGAPTRAIQNTASKNSRLSAADRPHQACQEEAALLGKQQFLEYLSMLFDILDHVEYNCGETLGLKCQMFGVF